MLFGTSGIRGVYPNKVSPELALDVGKALGTFARGTVVVACDPRLTSELLKKAAVAGLLSAGCDVIDGGMEPTPVLALATTALADAGLMITASHNPPEYNGMKLWQSNGMAFVPEHEQKIEKLALSRKFRTAPWDAIGKYCTQDIGELYLADVVSQLPKLRLKVAIDPGSGATCFYSPRLFRQLGCRISTINDMPDGRFRNRPSEPAKKNLRALTSLVRNSHADFGLAHDGDGDRHAVIDEQGKFVSQDRLLALACMHYGGKVVTTVDASMLIEEVAGKGNVIRTRVGDVAVAEAIMEEKASFGGETSGCWIHPSFHMAPDGMLSGAVIAQLIQEKGPLSRQVGDLPTYYLLRDTVKMPDPQLRMAELKKCVEGEGKLTTVDGIRLELDDGWLLVRPSGTEPAMRLTVEARTEEYAQKLLKYGRQVIKKC